MPLTGTHARLAAPSRYEALVQNNDPEAQRLKMELIKLLREKSVYVLARGCIEDYYPTTLGRADKVSSALEFTNEYLPVEHFDQGCHGHDSTLPSGAFTSIFSWIF